MDILIMRNQKRFSKTIRRLSAKWAVLFTIAIGGCSIGHKSSALEFTYQHPAFKWMYRPGKEFGIGFGVFPILFFPYLDDGYKTVSGREGHFLVLDSRANPRCSVFGIPLSASRRWIHLDSGITALVIPISPMIRFPTVNENVECFKPPRLFVRGQELFVEKTLILRFRKPFAPDGTSPSCTAEFEVAQGKSYLIYELGRDFICIERTAIERSAEMKSPYYPAQAQIITIESQVRALQ